MARFEFIPRPLAGLYCVVRQRLEDARGFLSRTYCVEEFASVGAEFPVVQINHSCTRSRGTVRRMHFQRPPHSETKLVSCLWGEIFDVAIDLRVGSPTFLQWHGEVLSAENGRALLIPSGFAHGFQTLHDNCELIYLHSATYRTEVEGAVDACDPALSIDWLLPIAEISDRDRGHPFIEKHYSGMVL